MAHLHRLAYSQLPVSYRQRQEEKSANHLTSSIPAPEEDKEMSGVVGLDGD